MLFMPSLSFAAVLRATTMPSAMTWMARVGPGGEGGGRERIRGIGHNSAAEQLLALAIRNNADGIL
jgi:hypothetical protein